MNKNEKNGQNCVAASAQENEIISENTIEKAFLKSMTWFVNGKGVEVYVEEEGKYEKMVWVEKSKTKNGLVYKFTVECNGKRRSVEIDSATWSDYSLFSGDTIKVISKYLYGLVDKNEKEG